MIIVLLWLLAIGIAAIVLYVLGAFGYSIFNVIRQRGRDKAEGQLAPLWRDTKVLQALAQAVFLVVAAAIIWFLTTNFQDRVNAIGLNLNFNFLDEPAGITIADNPLEPADTVGTALTAGFMNTIRIIVLGIPLAVIVGTLIGIARLSSNWLVNKLASGYVEFFRNIPPLVIIVAVWNGLYLTQFPRPSESWTPLDAFIFNNDRFGFPSVEGLDNFPAFRLILLFALIAAIGVGYWRTQVFIKTGAQHHRLLWGLGTFVGIGAVAFIILGAPAKITLPSIDETGRIYEGGVLMQMTYAALLTALVLYTGSHIAEIVRGSILAVHKGQVEASDALALSGLQKYRFVILPQAMRIAWPSLINQFLNLAKNSSLATLIGFAEITSIVQNLAGQSLPAPQLILILMLMYLLISLVLSAIGNLINRCLQLVGR